MVAPTVAATALALLAPPARSQHVSRPAVHQGVGQGRLRGASQRGWPQGAAQRSGPPVGGSGAGGLRSDLQ
eukprot:5327819-Prymnesium_polylepis.1